MEPTCPIRAEMGGKIEASQARGTLYSATAPSLPRWCLQGREWAESTTPTCGSVPCTPSSSSLSQSHLVCPCRLGPRYSQFHLLPKYLLPDATIPQNTWLALCLKVTHTKHTSPLLLHMTPKPKVKTFAVSSALSKCRAGGRTRSEGGIATGTVAVATGGAGWEK